MPDTVAGANGEEEIVLKCCDIYSVLYNSAGKQKGMEDLKKEVSQSIGEAKHEIDKVTAIVVKEAVMSMKSKKSDVTESFTLDDLLEGPDILFQHLSLVFKGWLHHDKVSYNVLDCSFLPLLKSFLKDPADIKSYRTIAGSSLILKLFEKLILIIWGGFLTSDGLQFG